jgi:hypothetical protein
MPVPSTIADLSTTAASNSPGGSEAILPNLDDYLRKHASFIAQNYAARSVSPLDFGAVGDGATDDTAAIVLATASGRVVDGGGRIYAVTGTLTVDAAFKGFHNIQFKQLTPTATDCRTLLISGVDGFTLRDVTVDRGGSAGYTVGTIADYAGIWITGCDDWFAQNCLVTNGGRGNGWSVQTCVRFHMSNCGTSEHYWQEVNPASPVIVDDIIQAFWFNTCAGFVLLGCYASHVTSGAVGNYATGVATAQQRRYTRLAFSGCGAFNLQACWVDDIDQGFDLSGTVGNNAFVLDACRATDCGTYGFKFANSAYNGIVSDCIARDCGLMGFVVSGMTEVSNPLVRDIDFDGCKAIDTGSNGIWTSTNVAGFRVASVVTVDASYPRAIRFKGCSVENRSGTLTTDNGFVCDVSPIEYPTAGYDAADGITCDSACTVAPLQGAMQTTLNGIHRPVVKVTGTGTDSLTTATWAAVSFDTDISDTSGMHSTSSNATNIYIKEIGNYIFTAAVEFAANATGTRDLRLLLNGTAEAGTSSISAHPTGVTFVQISMPIYISTAGQNVRLEARQSSGGALNVNRANSYLWAAKV